MILDIQNRIKFDNFLCGRKTKELLSKTNFDLNQSLVRKKSNNNQSLGNYKKIL